MVSPTPATAESEGRTGPTGYIETRTSTGAVRMDGVARDSEAREPSGGGPRLGGGARRARLLLGGACGSEYGTRGCILPFTPSNRHPLLANGCEFEWGFKPGKDNKVGREILLPILAESYPLVSQCSVCL